jgi:hypothetical protein
MKFRILRTTLMSFILSTAAFTNVSNAGLIDVEIDITGLSEQFSYETYASCVGEVTSGGGYGGYSLIGAVSSCDKTYSDTGASSTATSDIDGTTLASLTLDVTGESAGYNAFGNSKATISGWSNASTFTVDFTVDAYISGELSGGSFGLWVNINPLGGNANQLLVPPVADSWLIGDSGLYDLGTAWIFDYTADDAFRYEREGKILDRVSVTFEFDGQPDVYWVDFTAFAYGDVTSVPEPSTLAIFALGIMGLASRRFKKQS